MSLVSRLRPLGFAFSYDPTSRAAQDWQVSGIRRWVSGIRRQVSGVNQQTTGVGPAETRPALRPALLSAASYELVCWKPHIFKSSPNPDPHTVFSVRFSPTVQRYGDIVMGLTDLIILIQAGTFPISFAQFKTD